MAARYEEDDIDPYAEPGSPVSRIAPPKLPPRGGNTGSTIRTSTESLYRNQYGSVQTLLSGGSISFLSVATAGSTTSLNTSVSEDLLNRDYYYTGSLSGTLNRVPSEYQLLSEIPAINSPQKRVEKCCFISTKTPESCKVDNNGMFVKESVYSPSGNWPDEVDELVKIYERPLEDIEKQNLKRHIATKTLKFLERRRHIFQMSKLLYIDSKTIRNLTAPVLLQESLEMCSQNTDTLFEALSVLASTLEKEPHSIMLIVFNLISFIFATNKGTDDRKQLYKRCKKIIKPLLMQRKTKHGPFMLLDLFIGQLKQTKDNKSPGKRGPSFPATNFFEQYSFLFGLLNKLFTATPLDTKLLDMLQEAAKSLVNSKQKLDIVNEAMFRLIVTACKLLLKNDAYLDLQPTETTHKLLDILCIILDNIKVSQEIRIKLITILEQLLYVENAAVVAKIHFLFATNHRSPLQMSKLVREYISKELLHSGIRFFQDSSLNEQVPVWQSTEGSVLYMNKAIIAHYLVPSQRCLLKGIRTEYKTGANKQETERHLNNLDILIHLQQQSTHNSIIQLLAYQIRPMPLFYITEKVTSLLTLNRYLLNLRKKSKWQTPHTLAKLALEIVDVVVYLHAQRVIQRDLTSHAFVICDGGQRIVLYDFSIAIFAENNTEVTTDNNSRLIPTLWSSPESILENKFSFKSDVWMVGLVIYELFTHGCQPYTEMYTFGVDKILSYIIFHRLVPKRWPCIPPEIYDLMIDSLHFDQQKRIDSSDILQRLKDFVEYQYQGSLKKPNRPPSEIFEEDKLYPNLDPKQDVPVRGLPPLFEEMKKQNIYQKDAVTHAYENLQVEERTKNATLKIKISDLTSADRPDVKNKGDQIHVTEQVSAACIDNLRLHLNNDTYENILQMSKTPIWHKTVHPNEFDYILEYEMNCTSSLTELAKSRYCGDPNDESISKQYVEVVLKMVQFVMDMNSQGWVLGSMKCSDMYGAMRYDDTHLTEYDVEKVVMARLGRMLWFDRTGLNDDYIIAANVGSDGMRWCPVEVLQYKQYSFASDVYSLAMTIYEFYMTLTVNETDPLAGEVECAPFPYVSIEDAPLQNDITIRFLQSLLYRDGKPGRPAACPDWLYQELCKCWGRDEKTRPSCEILFNAIKRHLKIGSVSDIPNDDEIYEINDDYDNVKENIVYEEIVPFDCVNSDTDSDVDDKIKKSEQKRQKKKARKQKEQLTTSSSESERDSVKTTSITDTPKQRTTTAVFSLDV